MSTRSEWVWITHPDLPATHDERVLRAALGMRVASGWQERDDQSDPTSDVGEPVEADEPDTADEPAVSTTPDSPDADEAPVKHTQKER